MIRRWFKFFPDKTDPTRTRWALKQDAWADDGRLIPTHGCSPTMEAALAAARQNWALRQQVRQTQALLGISKQESGG